MRFTKIFSTGSKFGLVAVLVCLLSQWALGQKAQKPRFPASTYKTTAKIFLKDEYRMYDSAIVILNEAVSFYPNDAELHFLLGKAYYHRNMPKEMGQQFSEAGSLKIQPKFQQEIQEMRTEKWLQAFNQGAKAFNEQNLDTALEKFTECTIIDPFHYRAFMNVGYAYSLKGENDKAISYVEQGLKLAPDSLDILRIYATVLHNAGKVKEALEVYLKVAKKDPQDANTLNNIVSIYGVLKDYDKALEFSQKLIEADSSFKDAYFNMGTIYLQQIQEINLAFDSLKDTTGAYRTDEKSKAKKEELEKKRGELLTKAENSLVKATQLDTLDFEARLFLVQVYLEQEKLDQALGSLEFMVQKDSTNCEALVKLWAVYAKRGMEDKAKETLRKAKAQNCVK
jgi:tetratricopeptide (TPR) repeat protein